MTGFTESVVEEAALEWFGGLGYAVVGVTPMSRSPSARLRSSECTQRSFR